ncbi:hypothetical protein ACHAWF_015286 [Thalassiosira exigua]
MPKTPRQHIMAERPMEKKERRRWKQFVLPLLIYVNIEGMRAAAPAQRRIQLNPADTRGTIRVDRRAANRRRPRATHAVELLNPAALALAFTAAAPLKSSPPGDALHPLVAPAPPAPAAAAGGGAASGLAQSGSPNCPAPLMVVSCRCSACLALPLPGPFRFRSFVFLRLWNILGVKLRARRAKSEIRPHRPLKSRRVGIWDSRDAFLGFLADSISPEGQTELQSVLRFMINTNT